MQRTSQSPHLPVRYKKGTSVIKVNRSQMTTPSLSKELSYDDQGHPCTSKLWSCHTRNFLSDWRPASLWWGRAATLHTCFRLEQHRWRPDCRCWNRLGPRLYERWKRKVDVEMQRGWKGLRAPWPVQNWLTESCVSEFCLRGPYRAHRSTLRLLFLHGPDFLVAMWFSSSKPRFT